MKSLKLQQMQEGGSIFINEVKNIIITILAATAVVNGQMTLDFEHLTGNVDLKVYDMRGVQVDHVQTFNSSDRNSMPYDMQGRPDGIYLFVMSGREGTVVQKVIINR